VPVMIGTSGWQYSDWASGAFYPKSLPKARWLHFYAQRFRTLESNSAFYKLPSMTLFEDWASQTPDDFVMTVKASRFLTHVRRLRAPEEPVARLLESTQGLGHKLGPILLQLPPTLSLSLDGLAETLSCFPATVKVAVELRHSSWFVGEVRSLLEEKGAALCLTDRINRQSPLWRTAHWGYVRFHEGTASPRPSYGRAALDRWAERISSLWSPEESVFCYFNNDVNACAPKDAHQLGLAVKRHGYESTRTTAPEEPASD
jgi:uncharacterized protein YecE (DUF72 family)